MLIVIVPVFRVFQTQSSPSAIYFLFLSSERSRYCEYPFSLTIPHLVVKLPVLNVKTENTLSRVVIEFTYRYMYD